MTSTSIYLTVMVAMIVTFRLAAWQGLCLVSHHFGKSVTVFSQVQVRKDVSGLGSRIRASFPEITRLLTARLTPSRFAGLTLTLFVIAAEYGFIAYIIARNLTTTRQRFEIIYWTAVLICLIGFSRMLLGVHYASDVAAGFLVGGFWLLLGFAVAEHKHQHHQHHPPL